MKKLILSFIRLYQQSSFLRKPILKTLFISESSCRFTPTCSEYTYQAIEKYGSAKGLFLGFKRILRCHPWSKGGNEPLR